MKRILDLRTGVPVWTAYRVPRIATSRLSRDARCDVLVVGLGISGAMVAEALTARGLSVIGVDRRGCMLGSTSATTALVQFEIDRPLTELADLIGTPDAQQAWRRSRLAVTGLQGRIGELGIRCRLAAKQSLFLAGNALGPKDLRREAEARSRAGLRATYLSGADLQASFGIDRPGAILSHDNLAVDPRQLTAGLLRASLARGARFHTPVEITRLAGGSDGVAAETRDGPSIAARHVVLATGYELHEIVPADTHSVVSTYAIATRPQKAALWPGAAFVWEASEPYLYLRATADGRVICGGEDEDFVDEAARDRLLPEKTRTIAAKLKALFPHLDTTAAYAWAGSFGTTTTGLPRIGELPGHPNIFAVQGYGGNGITFSQIASEIIATKIAGGDDCDEKLFAFGRRGNK